MIKFSICALRRPLGRRITWTPIVDVEVLFIIDGNDACRATVQRGVWT